jgi:ABC-type transporter Mla maintaining outer membrane lipid asymmetry ATPase subunit MlaF
MTPVREPLEFVQEDKEEDLAMPPVKELLSVRSPLAVPGSSLLDARAVSMKFDRRCVFLEEAALEFNDVVFVAGSGKKKSVIVKKVGTKVSHGHVLAIMGPSGKETIVWQKRRSERT